MSLLQKRLRAEAEKPARLASHDERDALFLEAADRIESLEHALQLGAERCLNTAKMLRENKSFDFGFLELTGYRLNVAASGGNFNADISEIIAAATQTQGA